MNTPGFIYKYKAHFCALFLITFVCHWPILVFDGFMWDDVAFWKAQQIHNYQHLIDSFTALGKPHGLFPYWIFLNFDHNFILLRMTLLMLQYAISALVFFFCVRNIENNAKLALIVAVFSVTWPAMLLNQMIISLGLFFAYANFVFGCCCYAEWLHRQPPKYFWLFISFITWVVSFCLSSTLVFFYGFWLCIGLYLVLTKNGIMKILRKPSKKMYIHASLLLFPVGYYFLEKRLFPLHPFYGGGKNNLGEYYNKPNFEVTTILHNLCIALKNSLEAPIIHIENVSVWFLILVGILSLTAGLLLLKRIKSSSISQLQDSDNRLKKSLFLAVSGLVMLICGLFPYLAVGKPAGIIGVKTRYALLVSLPVGLSIAGLYGLLTSINKKWMVLLMNVTLSFLVLSFIALQFENYVNWQVCSIKDKAIVEALRKEEPLNNVDLYVIRGRNLEGIYNRRWYDWGCIMSQAWGGFERIGIYNFQFKVVDSHLKHPLLGIWREKAGWFMHWMGFGVPYSSDVIGFIDLAPYKSDISKIDKCDLFWKDMLYRFCFSSKSRQQWLAGFFTASVSRY